MVIRASVKNACVDIGAGAAGKAFEKIVHQFRLQIAHQPRLDPRVDHCGGAAREVHGGQAQSFVHRHQEVAGAHDAALIAQRLVEGLAQGDAHVFHGVVLVHVEIAGGFRSQIESAMVSEELQHVIEETDAGGDFITAASIDERDSTRCRFLWFCDADSLSSLRHLFRNADFGKNLCECGHHPLIVFFRSQRDANTSRAAGIFGAVAHQDAASSHGGNKCGMRFTQKQKDKVGAARPVPDMPRAELGFEGSAPLLDVVDVGGYVVLIGQGIRQTGQSGDVQIVGRAIAA